MQRPLSRLDEAVLDNRYCLVLIGRSVVETFLLGRNIMGSVMGGCLALLILFLATLGARALPVYAGQSTITVVDGKACMGDDKSRSQTEAEALINAKRKAVEFASSYLRSETRVKDLEVEKDLIDAYAHATIKVIEEYEKAWYKDPALGECFRLKIKAEVIPDEQAMTQVAKGKGMADDPSAPLNVQVWTNKREYKQSEKIRVYLKGNKPFYARVVYKDASGTLLQLLPNSFRTDNYFNGGVVYEIPSGNDRFELEVSPPFGEENVVVYSSLSPLGDISLEDAGGVYQIKTQARDIAVKTRGIKLKEKTGKDGSSSEFFEGKAILRTGK
jgi:hypothetical protein